MNVAILEMPESLQKRLVWLERMLMGPELLQLVEQLEIVTKAVRVTEVAPKDVLAILGDSEQAVLESGLSSLNEKQLRLLLSNPLLLLELQQFVLASGAEYWIDLCNRCNQNRFRRPQLAAESPLSSSKAAENGSPINNANSPKAVQPRLDEPASKLNWIGALALAATILLAAVGGWWVWNDASPQSAAGWGFSNVDVLAKAQTPEDYFQALSAAANQWFNKPVTDADQLSQRLVQFSHGCEKLLQAKHSVLAPAQRAWLIEKCDNWKEKIDQLALAVADGSTPFEQGLEEANEIANRMVKVLAEEFPKV